ncbi:General amino acid permease [Lasiodiplodia theobromae]|uniref:General amino acid permease n=1 Tax=Lasiodiplodia theobromae TaxID=45133 RepID=UPI0015C3C6A8|nr:General amino acid permease [Lasiodiplodia theobromae]KAF4538849.1 General amino acid permease [Lasiodiplodia theobromae]
MTADSLSLKQVATTTKNESGSEAGDYAIGESTLHQAALQRHLKPRQVQFFAIGGSIGTALFITIGYGLLHGGAGSLLIAFILQSIILSLVNNALAEMTIFMPVSAAFIQHADVWVDKAWAFMIGWNFFLFEAILVPFEITALDLILTYWRDDIPSAAVISACIFTYGITNILAVGYFGEAEFWLSIGKLCLIILVYTFTLVTMCGGNPQGHAYGFSNWTKPGPFVAYISTGDLGRFHGFLSALWQAAFIVVGPEYLAACAGEVQNPRKTLRSAFKHVYWRFALFFVCGALCVGIILPANDPTLNRVLSSGETGTGASSPFIIAMANMGVGVLPHIVNGLLLTSIYSAGNCYVYTTVRSLHGLASNGHAPKIFLKTTKNGVPIYSLGVALAFGCLAYLKLNSGTMQVLNWFVNLVTSGTLIAYIVICVNYLFFYRALKAQKYDRDALPYKGWFQPYGTWIALMWLVLVEIFYGYAVFLRGNWDVGTFFSSYTMAFLAIFLFTFWKIFKRTKAVSPHEADLVWARPLVDQHEALFAEVEEAGIWETVRTFLKLDKVGLPFRSSA